MRKVPKNGEQSISRIRPRRREEWSPEEDALLTELKTNGTKWKDIPERLPGRTLGACKAHWKDNLRHHVQGPLSAATYQARWSQEQNSILTNLKEMGLSWGDISDQLPPRSPVACMRQWLNLTRGQRRADADFFKWKGSKRWLGSTGFHRWV
jgi:hypothetical protein